MYKKGTGLVQIVIVILLSGLIVTTLSYSFTEFIRYYSRNKETGNLNNQAIVGLERIKQEISQSEGITSIMGDYIEYINKDSQNTEIYQQNEEVFIKIGASAPVSIVKKVKMIQFEFYDASQDAIKTTLEFGSDEDNFNLESIISIRGMD